MNTDTHYFLYAKGHYKKTDLHDDLRHIHAEQCALKFGDCHIGDVLSNLLDITAWLLQNRGDPCLRFTEFVKRLLPQESWRLNTDKDTALLDKMLLNCLLVLRATRTVGLDLGDPDPNILPLAHGDQ